jgi:hypothetical protein
MKLTGKPMFDPKTDPFAHYRIIGGALAVLIVFLGGVEAWRMWTHPACRDFIAFWGAAKLAIGGSPALAYDPAVLHKLQTSVASFGPHESMPFPYMPGFLLLVLPFGLLSYPAAMTVWVCLTLVAYLFAVKRLVPDAGLLALAFPPIVVNIVVGQNGFLTAALFCGALALLNRRPFVAGLLIGCLVFKPQLGLLFPLALLAERRWRAITGAALSSIGFTLSGVLAFGPGTFLAWIRELPLFASIARDGTVGWIKLTSIYAAGRQAGLDAGPAFALHLVVLGAAAVIVWRVWRSDRDRVAKAAVLACATALSSTYMFLYDQLILIVPFFWLARQRMHPAILGVLWCLPIISIAQNAAPKGPVNLTPVVPVLLLALIVWQMRRDKAVPATAAANKSTAPLPAA